VEEIGGATVPEAAGREERGVRASGGEGRRDVPAMQLRILAPAGDDPPGAAVRRRRRRERRGGGARGCAEGRLRAVRGRRERTGKEAR